LTDWQAGWYVLTNAHIWREEVAKLVTQPKRSMMKNKLTMTVVAANEPVVL
jgi:hypothetical protein